MLKGKIGGLHLNTGQILSEGNVYNFNVEIVDGGIRNHQEVEFELSPDGNVKIIYGTGANKPTNKPKPTKKKENITSELAGKLVDNRELLTEDK